MPANRHLFTDRPIPSRIVVDSSFLFHALIDDNQGFHIPAREFAEALRISKSIVLYSSLVFLEAPQCWRRLYRAGLLIPSQREREPQSDRINAFTQANAALRALLFRLHKVEIHISKSLIASASSLVAEFGFLSSHDALAVAIARDAQTFDIAALDRDFRNVDGIELWDGRLT